MCIEADNTIGIGTSTNQIWMNSQHFDTEVMKLESSSNNKGGNELLKNTTKN